MKTKTQTRTGCISRGTLTGAVIALGAAISAAPLAQAAVWNVDFNHTNNLTQSGYDGFPGGVQNNTTVLVDGVDFTVFAPGNVDTRDRGAVGGGAHPQSDLLRDFLFRDGGFVVELGSVANPLPAGDYLLTGYHHDHNAGTQVPSAQYVVTDALATGDIRALARTNSSFDAPSGDPRTQVIQVRSDGSSPVVVDMQQSGLRGINAFDLESIAAPDTLKVDFGAIDHNRQQDFLAFDAVDKSATSIQRTQNYIASFGVNDAVQVQLSLDGAVGDMRAIDRGTPHNHPLGDLAASWIGPDDQDLALTLLGLEAGTYNMLSYHHDTSQTGTFDVLVDGGLLLSDLQVSTGNLGPGDSLTTAAFSFLADGINPVEITYDLTGSRFMVVNGFELSREQDTSTPPTAAAVPEPATALLGLAGLTALAALRRRRGMPESA